ncbi:MAG TPA: hypothetical protein VFC09_00365 [Candidatus Dormibacteraeota bacterium]|nr:hypothetical protein [Candidatus Dormibacteraeota bacterium]
MSATLHLLARDSDFQASWYYSAVIFAGLVLVGWAGWLVIRHLRAMWRRGDRGLAVAVATAVAVALLMFASMLATVAVALLPLTRRGGAG